MRETIVPPDLAALAGAFLEVAGPAGSCEVGIVAAAAASSPCGFFQIDPGGWGFISADLARPPTAEASPLSVSVSSAWDCR